nr:glutamate receptor ionotropic 3 [Pachyrhinus yasumatsui]
MGLTVIWWLVCLTDLFGFGVSQSVISIGVFSNTFEETDNINWNVISENLDTSYEFPEPKVKKIQAKDHFEAQKLLCDIAAQENGIAAVFGPEYSESSDTLGSICSYLGIPYITTSWRPKHFQDVKTSFNLYPENSLLAQAYSVVIDSLDWDNFVILYETEEGLLKLQDALKLQQHKPYVLKNTLIINKLDPSGDSRHIFKKIKNTPITRIVLDCKTENIVDLLAQAKEVKLLADFTTSFFLTSLDAHTLDFGVLNTKSNITTIRLYNPFEPSFARSIRKFHPGIESSKVLVKTALMHDAMLLLAESLNAIKSAHSDADIVYEPLFCNAAEKYNDKYGLVSAMQEADLIGGLTGQINLKNGKRENFELSIIEIDKPDKPIGIWNAENPSKVILTRNATEREAEVQKRLQSHNFIVASKFVSPYLFKNKDTEAVGNARYYGYSMDLFIEISKLLNISFEFEIVHDNSHASLQAYLVERRADLAICDFTITPQRREVIDFSMPFMTLGIGILHKKAAQNEAENLYGFLGPLSTKVWFYIGVLYLFISFTMVLVARMSTEDWENPHPCEDNPSELENIWNLKNCCWLTLGSICTQGCDILPKGICTRLATASWWFFSLIITSSYTANLAAFLTMSRKDDSIDSVEELATQSKVKYGCMAGGSTQTFFSSSNDTLYQRMWNSMINEKPSVFEDSNAKGVERIQSTKNELYAFFMESTGIEYELERKCDLKKIGNLLDSKSYGIGMPMNADYRHSINAAVLKLQETGKLNELKERWWKQKQEGEPCPSDQPVNTDALALANVGGIFIVLGVCIGIAFLIALLEFLWNVYNISMEEHITFLEAFKIELKFACNIFVTKKRAKPELSESSSTKTEEDAEDNKMSNGILPCRGSFLSINTASYLNRIGSNLNLDNKSVKSHKSNSKTNT